MKTAYSLPKERLRRENDRFSYTGLQDMAPNTSQKIALSARRLALSMLLLLRLGRVALGHPNGPNVTRCSSCDNTPHTDDLNVVKLLGLRDSAHACELACIAYDNTIPGAPAWDGMHPPMIPSPLSGWARCNSYTWFAQDGRCLARVDERWAPMDTAPPHQASSGRIHWPAAACSTDADCSYNGHCGPNQLCRCSAAWRGDKCQLLNLRPASRSSGGQWRSGDGRNISTWGGSVFAVNGTFRMWLRIFFSTSRCMPTANAEVPCRSDASHRDLSMLPSDSFWPLGVRRWRAPPKKLSKTDPSSP